MNSKFSLLALACVLAVTGCTPRGTFSFAPAGTPPPANVQELFVATLREQGELRTLGFDNERAKDSSFLQLDISIPPGHRPGDIEWPGNDVDPEKNFYVDNAVLFPDVQAFSREVRNRVRADKSESDEIVVFVHGYNNNLPEASYRLAQFANDIAADNPTVLYSWPSAAAAGRYIYDRDSIIYSRDAFEKFLTDLTGNTGTKVRLVGHSLGTYLVMETLRQMSISSNPWHRNNLSSVALVSPDIDIDVFLSQASRIDPLPDPFFLVVAETDKALKLSAFVTGQPDRLGSVQDIEALSDVDVTVIDVTQLSDGTGFDHEIALTSPAALSTIKSLETQFQNTEGDPFKTRQLSKTSSIVGEATRVILTPLTWLPGIN